MPAPGVGKKKKTRKQKAAITDQQKLVQRLLNQSIADHFASRTEKPKAVN
jgi:hypothetical protein